MEDFKLSFLFRSQLDYNLRDSTMSKRTQNTSMPICCRNSSCKAQAFASLIPKFYKLQLICMMFSLIKFNWRPDTRWFSFMYHDTSMDMLYCRLSQDSISTTRRYGERWCNNMRYKYGRDGTVFGYTRSWI